MVTKFILPEREKDIFELTINGESFPIPVRNSMTLGEVQAVINKDGTINLWGAFDFFRAYVRPEVLDLMTIDDFKDIVNEWAKAPSQVGDLSLGE